MLITVKKEVAETIEIKTPCWLYQSSPERWYFINENGDMTTVGEGIIILHTSENEIARDFTKQEIERVFKSAHGCDESFFKEALDRELFKIQETVTA